MKILSFAGSNSKTSINKQLATYACSLFVGCTSDILDLNDYEMPIYSIDREREGIPQLAIDFANKIDDSDLIIISLAEHNGAYTTAFKNIFDWVSRVPNRPHFGDKNVFLMATSPGANGGATVLEMAQKRLPFNGAKVISSFSLPFFSKNFDAEKGLLNPEKLEELKEKVKHVSTQLV